MLNITLIQKKYISLITLPDKKEGFYRIEYHTEDQTKGYINIEGSADRWSLFSDNIIKVTDDKGKITRQKYIKDDDMFTVKINQEKCIILSQTVRKERCKYKKLYLRYDDVTITIGQQNASISIANDYISRLHAVIERKNGIWTITDNGSKNGTYLNDRRVVSSAEISAGDVVFILGYKFIIGYDFIAANIYDNAAEYDKKIFFEPDPEQQKTNDEYSSSDYQEKFFYRTIKINDKKLISQELKLDAPPPSEKKEQVPAVLRIGPSVTMCGGSVMTAGYSVMAAYYRGTDISYAVPSVIMAGTMMCTGVLWPLIMNWSVARSAGKKENERRKIYLNYINTVRSQIKRSINDQSDIMNSIYCPAEKCASLAIGRYGIPDKYLWCKNIRNEDFLSVCLGKGDMDASIKLVTGERKIPIKKDSLEDIFNQLISEKRRLSDVNIPLGLREGYICGLTGDRRSAVDFIRSIIVQLTSLYSYDELKLVFIYNENESVLWNYSRWLPHVWTNDKTLRYTAVSNQDIKEISADLTREVSDRLEHKDIRNERLPYYLIISADRELTEKLEPINLIFDNYKTIRFGMFTLFNQKNYIDSDIIFDFENNAATMYRIQQDKDDIQDFVPDHISDSLFSQYTDCIANIRLELSSHGYSLPDMLTFLEMFRVSKAEHLNCLTRWAENDPSESLQTPIGINQSGDCFYLDLHEKFHGPHGLIAGTTGSGKSELIITFVLSLAVSYSPEEVAFLIIDYKGGGLADAFESIQRVTENGKATEKTVRLPHLAGTVTNLDGATIERSRISIESELRRRQNMFKQARKMSDEGTMDIYKYQKLRRNGMQLEALPHLFIICDEFAELRSQHVEFMDSLISTARIGRSLGVHLILATQKPDAVVSPQIWSNSRFKICLKVQDKCDSSAVIHCPDAAEISATGRFFLQVGYNDFFSTGQSAWCGADYNPSDSFRTKHEMKAELISRTGTVLCKKKIKPKLTNTGKTISELVAVRQYLIQISGNIHVRPLWLPPLPAYLSLHQLYKDSKQTDNDIYDIAPVIGKWDDLYGRKQEIMKIPFSKQGNVCVYGAPGSGSDMFLNTLVYSLVSQYTADKVNIYILDFDSGFMRIFEDAPQVGNVVLSDEEQNVKSLIAAIRNEIIQRGKLFSPYGGEYSEYCRRSGSTRPNIVLILNNYLSFIEQYNDLLPDIMFISREGTRRGVYLVVGSATVNVNVKLRQNIGLNYVLRMYDKMDYTMVLGRIDSLIPSEFKGRGILRAGSNVFEFQTADFMPAPLSDEEENAFAYDPVKEIRSLCRQVTGKCSTRAVNYIAGKERPDTPVLSDPVKADLIPLGLLINENDLLFEDLSDKYITFISSYSEKLLAYYALYLARMLSEDQSIDVVCLDIGKRMKRSDNEKFRYAATEEELSKWAEEYHMDYLQRDKELYQDESGKWKLPENRFRNTYIIVSMFESAASVCQNCAVQLNIAMLGCEAHNFHYIILDTPQAMCRPNGCYCRIIIRGNKQKDMFGQKNAHDDWFSQLGIWLGNGFEKQNFFSADNAGSFVTGDDTGVTISGSHAKEMFTITGIS